MFIKSKWWGEKETKDALEFGIKINYHPKI